MPTFEHGYALLVGVGADLQFTLRDTERVGELLRDPLRCGYAEPNVRLLLGSEANRTNVIEGLDWLIGKSLSDPRATIVFYYSGHGLAEPESTLVLNPCFGPDNRPRPQSYATEGLPGEVLCQKLAGVVSSKLLVMLDCCYANAQVATFMGPDREPDFLERLQAGTGRVVLASSTSDQKAWADGRESYFTAALLEGLAGYGSLSRDGYAKVFDITDYVQREVRRRSRDAQHPIFRGSDINQNFSVAYYAGGDPLPKDLSPANPLPRVPTSLETEVERAHFKDLERTREEARMLENEIAKLGGHEKAGPVFQKRRQQLDHKILQIEAKLGLLEQQSPFFQQISHWYGKIGVFTFLAALFGVLGTQSTFNGISDVLPTSFALLGLVLTSIGLFLNFILLEFFQGGAARGDWYYRLPIAFDLRTLLFNSKFARIFQVVTLVLFFAIPLYYQGHFLRMASYGWVRQTIPRDNAPPIVILYEIQGAEHLTRYFPFVDSVFTGWYWLGRPGDKPKDNGVSFFPFWAPWFLVITWLAWIAAFVRVLLRLARVDDGRPFFFRRHASHNY